MLLLGKKTPKVDIFIEKLVWLAFFIGKLHPHLMGYELMTHPSPCFYKGGGTIWPKAHLLVWLAFLSQRYSPKLYCCCWKWSLLVILQKSSVRYITLHLAGQKKRYSFLCMKAWIRTYSWAMDIYLFCWK